MKKFVVLLLCVFALIWMAPAVFAFEETVIVVSYAGEVKIIPADKVKPVACKPDMLLGKGTRIITGDESYIEIAFNRPKSNIVKVKENSEVVIKLEGNDRIELLGGRVFTLLRDLKRGRTFRVRTPCAVCGARGTGWLTATDGKVTDVAVFEGKVFVRGINRDGSVMEEEYWIPAGFERKTKRFQRPEELLRISDPRVSELKREFGNGTDEHKKGVREKKLKAFGRRSSMREEQMEHLQERKDSERLERVRTRDEKKQRSSKQ